MKGFLKLTGSILFVALAASAGLGQQRTFVSGGGADTNPCTLASPCRTFTKAISVNSSGGEVVALDAAQYDPFTISEAISIIAPFGAGISVPAGGDGIVVNPVPGSVVLRGLTINSQGNGSFGVLANSVGALHIEDCVVNGFNASSTAAGVQFKGSGKLLVKDTVARGNYAGIEVTASGKVQVSMDRLSLGDNNIGLFLTGEPGQVRGAIRNSSITGNAFGFNVVCVAGGKADLDVESCLITNNDYGLFGQNLGGIEAGISISNCTISHNDTRGFQMTGGAFIVSRVNNTIIGNGPSIPAVPTPFSPTPPYGAQ